MKSNAVHAYNIGNDLYTRMKKMKMIIRVDIGKTQMI